MSNAQLESWLARLATLHPHEIELGLERVREVALRLDLLPVCKPVVTVAGTNGKGSTVAVLDAVLTEAGLRTGTFTSPHLLHFNERIRVAGVAAKDEWIVAAFEAIDAARGAVSLTYFEFATLAALLIFKENAADIIVLEVGLGGRLDAVNIVDATVSVVTSIDLDHQDWLGGSRGEIAREKGAIVRSGRPVVIAEPDPPAELLDTVHAIGATPVLKLGRDFRVTVDNGAWQAQLQNADGSARLLPRQRCGALLPENVCAAVQAAILLGVACDDELLQRALARPAPVARRQRLEIAGLQYVLDVAHNPAAVNRLLEYLTANRCEGKTICLFSAMADKDISSMVQVAAHHFDAWFLADQPGNPRAATAQLIAVLLASAGQHRVSRSKNLRQALRRAQGVMSPGDRLVVFGSFFTVAGVLPLLNSTFSTDDISREAL